MRLFVIDRVQQLTIKRSCRYCRKEYTFSVQARGTGTGETRSEAEKDIQRVFLKQEQTYYDDEVQRAATGTVCPFCFQVDPETMQRFFPNGIRVELQNSLKRRLGWYIQGQTYLNLVLILTTLATMSAFLVANYFTHPGNLSGDQVNSARVSMKIGFGLTVVAACLGAMVVYVKCTFPRFQKLAENIRRRLNEMDDKELSHLLLQIITNTQTYDVRKLKRWYQKVTP